MNGQEWIDTYGVTFDWSAKGFHQDDEGWEHQLFTVTLTSERGGSVSFKWRQGMAVEPIPNPTDVLYALSRDAASGIESFYEFCDNYGYDTDSRKAYKTWRKCGKVASKMEDFSPSPEAFADFLALEDGE